MAQKDVVFRRINGRIVPIRRKGIKASVKSSTTKIKGRSSKVDKKELAKGAAFSGFGLISAITGGLVAGDLFKKGQRAKRSAFEVGRGSRGFGGGMEGAMLGATMHKKGKRRIRFGRKGIFGAKVVGGALLGQGIQKIAEQAGVEDSDLSNIVSSTAGEVASFGVAAGFKKAARGTTLTSSFAKVAKVLARRKFKAPI